MSRDQTVSVEEEVHCSIVPQIQECHAGMVSWATGLPKASMLRQRGPFSI